MMSDPIAVLEVTWRSLTDPALCLHLACWYSVRLLTGNYEADAAAKGFAISWLFPFRCCHSRVCKFWQKLPV